MLKSVQIKDHMSTRLVTLDPDMDILRAVRLLITNVVAGAPVVDGNRKLVGILTERDCMRVAMQAEYHGMPGGPVRRYMTKDPQFVSPDESILHVAQLFIDGKYHRYPVVKNDRLVGMISRRDVMNAMGKQHPM
ncbi:MAG: CBS domain-containing protein [Proteobacteria bacterium]|nr:CBS domain-containing protein [Pseudomonadota bacterium]